MLDVEAPWGRRLLKHFWWGLTGPTIWSSVGFVAVFLGWLSALVVLATPERLARLPHGSLAAHSMDEFGAMASDYLRLPTRDPSTFTVVLFGASATREALTSTRDLAERLSAGLNMPVEVVRLTAGGQFHPDALLLHDRLPAEFFGIVVVDVTPKHLALPTSIAEDMIRKPRLPFSSSLHATALAALGAAPLAEPTGQWLLDHHRFFVARPTLLWSLLDPPSTLDHFIEHWRPPAPHEWERIEANAFDWADGLAEHAELNARLYEIALQPIAAREHASVVLLEPPRNPDVVAKHVSRPDVIEADARYRGHLRSLIDSIPATHLDSGSLALPGSAFFDYSHIKANEERRRFTAWLADNLLQIATSLEPAAAR